MLRKFRNFAADREKQVYFQKWLLNNYRAQRSKLKSEEEIQKKNNETGPQRHDKIKRRRKRGTKIEKRSKKRKHRKYLIKTVGQHFINSFKSTSNNGENTTPWGWVGGQQHTHYFNLAVHFLISIHFLHGSEMWSEASVPFYM